MEVTSNKTLCDLFEALIHRFDKIEDRLDVIDARLASTVSKEQDFHFYTFPCAAFSGSAFCGRNVQLHTDDVAFDTDGTFTHEESNIKFRLFVTTPDMPFFKLCYASSWEECPTAMTYDSDLRKIWGMDKYNAIRLRIAENGNRTRAGRITAESVGIDSMHEKIDPAVYEIVLKYRVPAVMTFGSNGLVLDGEQVPDIRTAVAAMDSASALVSQAPCKYIQINKIDEDLVPLGIAYLHDDCLPRAYENLDYMSRETVLGMAAKTLFGTCPRCPLREKPLR